MRKSVLPVGVRMHDFEHILLAMLMVAAGGASVAGFALEGILERIGAAQLRSFHDNVRACLVKSDRVE